jgi:hypothetical protein
MNTVGKIDWWKVDPTMAVIATKYIMMSVCEDRRAYPFKPDVRKLRQMVQDIR